MKSPFPGMDPYLEDPAFWRDFHGRLVYAISEQLLDRLPGSYDAAVDEQVRLVERPATPAEGLDDSTTVKHVLPDVAVVHRPSADAGTRPGRAGAAVLEPVVLPVPVAEEVRERRVEIRHKPDDTLVTVIEVLSPTNKNADGFDEYQAKRRAVIGHRVSLVELDLLVGGRRPERAGPMPAGDYFAVVSRADRPGQRFVYAWPVGNPLPGVPIPLRTPDEDVVLDLAAAFADAYDRGRYRRRLHYDGFPVAPLSSQHRAWAAELASRPAT
jgi:hypothetical protein